MLNFKSLKEMKKVLLICVVALAFASCGNKPAEAAPAVDSAAVVDTTVAPVDTTVVDTTAAAVK